MDTSILEDIGLTSAEIKIYLTLLKLGSSQAGSIVEKSGRQNSVVHRTLHRLIEKSLITYVLEGKKKYYQAIDPKMLINYLENKKKRVEDILPELLAQQEMGKKKQEATIFRGIRGVKELLNQTLDTRSKEYLAYGGPQKAHDLLGDYTWASFHKKRIKNKIRAKLIFNDSLRWWGDELNKKKLTTVKYTKKECEQLTETIICGKKVAILVYSDKPYGFLIEDQMVSESYKKFFDILWKK